MKKSWLLLAGTAGLIASCGTLPPPHIQMARLQANRAAQYQAQQARLTPQQSTYQSYQPSKRYVESASYYDHHNTTYQPVQPPLHSQSATTSDATNVSGKRAALIKTARTTATKFGHLSYKFGSADPRQGGFDCSGSMYYVMRQSGLKPPRTSAQQYTWVRNAGNITHVPAGVTTLKHASFKKLKPGDLLFWSGTYRPSDGRKVNITHVAMFLGYEKGRPIMANATEGRRYNGKTKKGYGIYDFYLPKPSSRSKFVGYGPPPGV